MPAELREFAQWAGQQLQGSPIEISRTLRKHQLKLADRQCRIAELSGRVQSMIVMLATSLYAARSRNEVVRQAAVVFCAKLQRDLSGRRPADREFRAVTQLGQAVAEGGFPQLAEFETDEILMKYKMRNT